MKKGIAIAILTTILMMLSINILAVCPCTQNTVVVYVDGEKLPFPDQAPFINPDNRTLVPVRFVSEALGADVDWNGEQQRVDISHQGKGIQLTIGQREAQVDTGVVTLDTNAAITNSRTMVPLRFVSECLGAEVEWNGVAREVYITTQNAEPVKPFEGQPYNQVVDLPTSDYLGYELYRANEPGARVSYITVDKLPMRVGRYVIYSLTVDNEYVHVKQRAITDSNMVRAVSMHIKENGYLNRSRHYADGQPGIFIYSYPLTLRGEIADGIGKADKTKIEAFVFDDGINSKSQVLVIANPLYEGGN